MSERMLRSNEPLTAPMDDMLLMMSVDQGRYYGLTGVGPRIWELLENPITEAELIERLLLEYDIAPESCRVQVTVFLAGLKERGLLGNAD